MGGMLRLSTLKKESEHHVKHTANTDGERAFVGGGILWLTTLRRAVKRGAEAREMKMRMRVPRLTR